ncbi:MAG: carboxynorspermidine decarboxylase [Lachnospiraceae bacterium]|nr:carboxynorspermidine decarboxylase [Lachnospiraceae bacterium]
MEKNKLKALKGVDTPAYVIDIDQLRLNLAVLDNVEYEADCKVLLAQKAFSAYALYPLVGEYLSGTSSSGLYEARLAFEHMKRKEVHVYSPGYTENEMLELIKIADHIVFNSKSQWDRFAVIALGCARHISCGLRINPEYSEIKTPIYDPCRPDSRLGIKLSELEDIDFTKVEGLHFHTMCEQQADVFERTVAVIDEKFQDYIRQVKWVNFGGGQHITAENYDIKLLRDVITRFKNKYDVTVYLEPGEAVALNAGYLVASVVDVLDRESPVAILDTSACCHMPDVLEMPYRPNIYGASTPGDKAYTYLLGGPTCLAGDIIGEYSFDEPLKVGDKLVFTDMAIYTMVKNNTFNGRPLPAIATVEKDTVKVIKEFGYEDFKSRL